MSVTVTYSGPFFRPGVVDDVMKDAVTEIEREVVGYAAKVVKDELYFGHGVRSGKFKNSITGEVTQSRHGVVFARDVVKGPWLESGAGSRYGSTRFRGYSMFRRGRERADREAQRLADRVVGQAVRKLN